MGKEFIISSEDIGAIQYLSVLCNHSLDTQGGVRLAEAAGGTKESFRNLPLNLHIILLSGKDLFTHEI